MKKAMLLTISIFLCLSLSACGSKSKLTSAIERGDILTANSVFEDASSKDELIKVIVQETESAFSAYDADTINTLSLAFSSQNIDEFKNACTDGLENTYQAFMDGTIDYDVFESINSACILVVGAETNAEYSLSTEEMRNSRQAFTDAQEAEKNNDYVLAYKLYGQVIADDKNDFQIAQSKISELSEKMPSYGVGDSVTDDGVKVTFLDFSVEKHPYPQYDDNKESDYLICAVFLAENVGNEAEKIAWGEKEDDDSDFYVYADDFKMGRYTRNDEINGYKCLFGGGRYIMNSIEIESGRKAQGYITYYLPEGTKKCDIVFRDYTFSIDLGPEDFS